MEGAGTCVLLFWNVVYSPEGRYSSFEQWPTLPEAELGKTVLPGDMLLACWHATWDCVAMETAGFKVHAAGCSWILF